MNTHNVSYGYNIIFHEGPWSIKTQNIFINGDDYVVSVAFMYYKYSKRILNDVVKHIDERY